MKDLLFVVILAFAPFTSAPLWANACNESCLTATDCTDTNCPVCTGSCVSCWYLGDQTACQDTTTGASTYCYWMSTECTDVNHVPEVPEGARPLFLIFLAAIAVYFSYRVRLRSSEDVS